MDVLEVAAQHAGGDERIAAVVAGTGEHHDRAPAIAGKAQRGLRRRGARTLHEARRRRARASTSRKFGNREDGGQCLPSCARL